MGRTVKDKRKSGYEPRPVEKIELSDKNIKLRAIAAVLFLLLGAGLIAYAFMNFLAPETGWTTIISEGKELSCAGDFVFQYNVGDAVESKAVTKLYTEATEKLYRLFSSQESFEGLTNIHDINQKPNQELKIDPVLYNAFSTLEKYDNRYIYLAPAYEVYENLFYCENDSETIDFDPVTNEELGEDFGEIADFAKDARSVNLELLGDNKIRLFVSKEYLEYAGAEGITEFIDFYWIKNAFIVDYLAETMITAGYTKGSIASYDGFTRNFDQTGTEYSLNIFDKSKGEIAIYQAAVMHYTGPASMVFLRNFSMNSLDYQRFYRREDGQMRASYLDISDGMPKTALNNIVGYSYKVSCADVLLEMAPAFVTDKFSQESLSSLKADVYYICCVDREIRHNDKGLILEEIYSDEKVEYSERVY